MPAEAISESVEGVDIIFRGFSAKRMAVVRPAIMRDVRLLPPWVKALSVEYTRSKKHSGACVQCTPENHLAKMWLGVKWFDYPAHLRRVYVIHEINHMHHWAEADFVLAHMPASHRPAYLKLHEQSTDTWAYAVLAATEGAT